MNTKKCTVCLETKPIEKFQLCSKLCKSCKSKKYYNPDYYKKYYETNKDYFKKYYDDNRESIISYQIKRLKKIHVFSIIYIWTIKKLRNLRTRYPF